MEKITWTKVEKGILKSNTGKYRARITRTVPDKTKPDGITTKQYCRDARTLSDAKAYRTELEADAKDIKAGGGASDPAQNKIKGRRMKFKELAEIFQDRKLVAPTYDDPDSDDRMKQNGGLVRFEDSRRFLATLILRFGQMLIRDITFDHILKFKLERLKEPKRFGGKRTISGVHRELQVMQSVLAYGATKGYLDVSPFKGDVNDPKLIDKGHERGRDRTLSFAEERRLLNELAASAISPVTADRKYLREVLIFLLDTPCRNNERKQLERRDIDLNAGEYGQLNIRRRTTKTQKPKMVPIFTPRLRAVLEARLLMISDDPRVLVFGSTDVKKSFASAKKRAGIKDYTIHDNRHTCISRWIEARMSAEMAMEYAGIKSFATFQRYLKLSKVAHKKNTGLVQTYLAENLVTNDLTTTASEAVN